MSGIIGLTDDKAFTAELQSIGLRAETIYRSETRLIVVARNYQGLAMVAVVDRSPDELDRAFLRLLAKGLVR